MTSPITIPRTAPITDMTLGYDGATSYLAVPQILAGQPLASLSIEAWVNVSAPASESVFANNHGSFALIFHPASVPPPVADVRLTLAWGSTPAVTYTPLFVPGLWYYVVVTYDSAAKSTTLFVNA